MKVLHLIETFGRGGTEQALVNLVPSLMAAGVDVEICALSAPYTLADELERRGIVVHRLDIPHRWDLAHAIPRVAALLRQNYDILHAQSFFPALYIALARPKATSRRVITFHSLDYDSYPATTPWHRLRKRLDGALMSHAMDVRLAVSPAVAMHYREHLGLRTVEVVYNAIEVGRSDSDVAASDRESTLRPFGIQTDDELLLVPGRYVHEKGHRFFVEAFRLLMAQHPRLKALLVGEGPLKAQIEELVRAQCLDARILVRGAAEHSDLLRLMSAADVIVVPSTHEGFGLAAAEGMALGKAVVATSVGGIPMLIESEESGILVPPADSTALAAAIDRLLRDARLRARLGKRGRERVEERFTPPAIAAELKAVYVRALGCGRTRSDRAGSTPSSLRAEDYHSRSEPPRS